MFDALFEQAQRLAVVRFATGGTQGFRFDEDPAAVQGIAKLDPRVRFYQLDNAEKDEWAALYKAFGGAQPGSKANFGPWRRVLSVLRANGAITCVVEEHYICLDYKSELLTFYSQLDATRTVSASRLHFFAKAVHTDNLWGLPPDVCESYLGYVVCRPGRLPLVGRTVIRPPRLFTEDSGAICATVEDKVNFFGQKLTVVGAPFMQQDEGLTACAEVTLWASTYLYFRRGAIQRRLVADIANLVHPMKPMTPYATNGLHIDDVGDILRAVGLRGKVFFPSFDANTALTPVLEDSVYGASEIVTAINRELKRYTAQMLPVRRNSRKLPDPNKTDLVIYAGLLNDLVDKHRLNGKIRQLCLQLMDCILAHILKPYLRSRVPAYMATETHAMLLVGTIDHAGQSKFIVHDDQNGPYLAMTSLVGGSLLELEHQAFSELESTQQLGDLDDRAVEVIKGTGTRPTRVRSGSKNSRRVEEIVVPLPTRFFADPNVALEDARQIMRNAASIAKNESGFDEAIDWQVSVTIAMGIDYKRDRCSQLLMEPYYASRQAIGSIHLSEWVIVVEGRTAESTEVSWEFVYDGTASTAAPIVQLARIGQFLIAGHPAGGGEAEGLTLATSTFRPFRVDSQLGKY